MPVIAGTLGPITEATGSAPEEGTDAVQLITIDATGGTFALEWRGKVSEAIHWVNTDVTMVSRTQTGLTGVACVQTLTFLTGLQSGDKFKLRFKDQETAPISWSGTSNTLRDNIDTALEALGNIPASGVVTAVGTMTSGIGTITVTFAARGVQPRIVVSEERVVAGRGYVTGAVLTTPGIDGPFADGEVVVTEDSLTSGVGTMFVTFSGDTYTKRTVELITVADNSLTGAGTLTVEEDTAGVDAFGRGLAIGGVVVDTTTGVSYENKGTATAPDYKAVTTS